MPLTPALGRAEEFEGQSFEASLVYIVSSRTAGALERDSVSKKEKRKLVLTVKRSEHGI